MLQFRVESTGLGCDRDKEIGYNFINTMKVVILCGGKGTRLREETEFRPKPLVEVGGMPLLWHIMKIYAHYGFREFVLALGYKGNMIKDYFLRQRVYLHDFTLDTKNNKLIFHNENSDDYKITFVDTGLESLTGERVRRIKEYITEDNFMLTYGDGVGDIDLNRLIEFHKAQNTIGTITGIYPLTRYGIVMHDETTNKVTGFRQNLVGDFGTDSDRHDFIVNGGFMIFKRQFLDTIERNSMIESAFIPLAKRGQLSVYKHQGNWKAMDTFKEVEELNHLWVKNPFWKVWKAK